MEDKTQSIPMPAPDPTTSSAELGPPDAPRRRRRHDRIAGVDLARGVALVGMIGAHSLDFSGDLGWNPSTWAEVVNGRSSILFAVLAGVSVALMTGRSSPVSGDRLRDARTRLLVRAVLVFTVGAVLTVISTHIGIILQVYAVLLVAVLPVLRWSVRRLAVLAVVLAVASPVVNLLGTYGVARASSPLEPGEISLVFLGGTYPAVVWSVFTVLGLLVGRLDLASVRVATRVLLVGALLAGVGYTAGWASTRLADARGWLPDTERVALDDEGNPFPEAGGADSAAGPSGSEPGEDVDLSGRSCVATDELVRCGAPGGVAPQSGPEAPAPPDLWQLLGAEPHSGTTFEVLGSAGVALAVLGLCLLVPPRARWAVYPVRAAGSLPLTIYTAHVVVMEVAGTRHHGDALFVGQVVAALAFASVWSRWRGQGPLENAVATVARRTATGGYS